LAFDGLAGPGGAGAGGALAFAGFFRTGGPRLTGVLAGGAATGPRPCGAGLTRVPAGGAAFERPGAA
jgi:hypothetical protein